MKQIRNSVFETNSSSTHSVSIKNFTEIRIDDLPVSYDDNRVHTSFGRFGWEVDFYRDAETKLSYLITMIAEFEHLDIWRGTPWNEDILNERLMESEDFRNINDVIAERYNCDGVWVDSSEGYIDHQSYEDYNCINDFLNDWGVDSVDDFIFNCNIVLHTDNDNH